MANSWGESGTTWGQGDWGNQNNYTLTLTGLSMTGSLGEAAAYSEQGWGRASWGNEPWGESYDPVVAVSGFSITASLGTLPYAQSEEGWGRDEWGIGNWGENTTTVADITGFEMTAALGPSAWGQAPWDEMIGWGGDLRCETTQLSIAALTGIEATASLGTPTISRLDMIFDLTTSLEMSVGLGVLNINNGADHSQGVGSLLATGSIGTPIHEMAYDLTGIEATGYVGSPTITSAKLVTLTNTNLVTGSLGSVTVADMSIGLSGLAITGNVGSISPTEMVMGLTGISATASVADMTTSSGGGIIAYADIDTGSDISYSNIATGSNTSYSDVA